MNRPFRLTFLINIFQCVLQLFNLSFCRCLLSDPFRASNNVGICLAFLIGNVTAAIWVHANQCDRFLFSIFFFSFSSESFCCEKPFSSFIMWYFFCWHLFIFFFYDFRALKPFFPIDDFVLNWLCVMQWLNHIPTMAIKSNCTNNSLMKYVWMHRNSKCIYIGLKHWMATASTTPIFFLVALYFCRCNSFSSVCLVCRHGKFVGRCSGDIRFHIKLPLWLPFLRAENAMTERERKRKKNQPP